jgi:NAD(P)-dependent dehydrogenase (short-subunit alcohol dehydrogenase family)
MSMTNQNKIPPKKALVTGASGLLGVAAIEKFLAAGWEFVGVSDRKPSSRGGLKEESNEMQGNAFGVPR